MKNYNPKSIINKYNLCLLPILVILFAIDLLLFFDIQNMFWIYLVWFVIFEIAVLFKKTILYNTLITSIITKEANLPKYIDVIAAGKIVSYHLLEQLFIAYYSGDYNMVINICTAKLNDKKCAKLKHFYLLYLARTYFELGDMNNLRAVNDMFNYYVANHKKGEKIKKKVIYFKFLDYCLKNDFTAAKEMYEKLYSEQSNRAKVSKTSVASIAFTYAICCYRCGDLKKAVELFNTVIDTAPLINYTNISKKYLIAIENNEVYNPEELTINIDITNIPKYNPRIVFKIFYVTGIALMLLSILLSGIYAFLSNRQPKPFKDLTHNSTRADIEKLYGKPDKTEEFEYPKNYFEWHYDEQILDIKAYVQAQYNENGNLVRCEFVIDSNDFADEYDYQNAVQYMYRHFDKKIFYTRKVNSNQNEQNVITWYDESKYCAYMMYETETWGIDDAYDNLRPCAVFSINFYNNY